MLEYIIAKVAGKSFFFKPRVMTCIPVGITSVEKRAVLEATMQAGVSKTFLIEEPLAAALGAGLDIVEPSGKLVVDIGGGTTDIAILSLGGVVDDASIRVGGDKFDDAIVRAGLRNSIMCSSAKEPRKRLRFRLAQCCPAGKS
jgi:rod shape-determining protein MreB